MMMMAGTCSRKILELLCVVFLVVALFSDGVSTSSYPCTRAGVYSRLNEILNPIKTDFSNLTYHETLNMTKQITSAYFIRTCGAPRYYEDFENVSQVQTNKAVVYKVEDGMMKLIEQVGDYFDHQDQYSRHFVSNAAARAHQFAVMAFTISYRYSPIQVLICTQLLALRLLATKSPTEDKAKAQRDYQSSIDLCSHELNTKEYDLMVLQYNTPTSWVYYPFTQSYLYTAHFSYEDTFDYFLFCARYGFPKFCHQSCEPPHVEYNLILNPVLFTFKKVFSPTYCSIRKKFGIYPTPQNIEAVDCLDYELTIHHDFTRGYWAVNMRFSTGFFRQFDREERTADGIHLFVDDKTGYIDVKNGTVSINNQIMCKKIWLRTRCELGYPLPGGPCYY